MAVLVTAIHAEPLNEPRKLFATAPRADECLHSPWDGRDKQGHDGRIAQNVRELI
jgi:hypothetical protein